MSVAYCEDCGEIAVDEDTTLDFMLDHGRETGHHVTCWEPI